VSDEKLWDESPTSLVRIKKTAKMQFFLLETTLRKHIATVKPNWAMSKMEF